MKYFEKKAISENLILSAAENRGDYIMSLKEKGELHPRDIQKVVNKTRRQLIPIEQKVSLSTMRLLRNLAT